MKHFLSTIFLLTLLTDFSWGATWYVRPSTDGNGNSLTYGLGDGTSNANAFSGFAAITGLAPGDTVCLPDASETFFERLDTTTAGTLSSPITYKSCGIGRARIWSAQELSANRSFDATRTAVSGSQYTWINIQGTTIWKKLIGVRLRMLWENNTWLQPVNVDTLTELAIIYQLTPGQWGMHNNGNGTFEIYYNPTMSTNTPLNTKIRADNVPMGTGSPAGIVSIDVAYITLQDIDVWGHTATVQPRALNCQGTIGCNLVNMDFVRNEIGPAILQVGAAGGSHTLTNVRVLNSSATGLYVSPGLGLSTLTVTGGEFSGSNASTYNGTNFTAGDGDGIGFGQGGGIASEITVKGALLKDNKNTGIFVGTTASMTVTNMYLLGNRFSNNANGCFGESSPSKMVGVFNFSGFDCSNIPPSSLSMGINITVAGSTPRYVTIANGTFSNNKGISCVRFDPSSNNNLVLRNLTFAGCTPSSIDRGDLYSNDATMAGNEVFQNLVHYSRPNSNNTLAKLGGVFYTYASNGVSFNQYVTATGCNQCVVNTDPLVIQSSK